MQKLRLREVKIFAISYSEEVAILGFFETKPMPHKSLEIAKFQAHCLGPKRYRYLIQYISGEKRGEEKKPPKHKLLKNKNKKISVTLQNRPTRSPALFRGSQKAEVTAPPRKALKSQTSEVRYHTMASRQCKIPKVDKELKFPVPRLLFGSLILPRLLPLFSRFGLRQFTHSHISSAPVRLWTHREHCLAQVKTGAKPISSQDTKSIREYNAQFSSKLLFYQWQLSNVSRKGQSCFLQTC